MDFTFTRAMMKAKKANPIKFESNWSKKSKEICTKSVQLELGFQPMHQLVFGA